MTVKNLSPLQKDITRVVRLLNISEKMDSPPRLRSEIT